MRHSPFQFYLLCLIGVIVKAIYQRRISWVARNLNDILIIMNENNSEQPSAADIQIEEEPSSDNLFIHFIRNRIKPIKVFKALLLVVLLALLIWIISYNLENALLKAKRQFKYKSEEGVQEISGLDEEGYRAYYYYKQMVNISRQNKARGKKFDVTTSHQFDAITFNELFGLFKVVKAIQYAKNYSAYALAKDDDSSQQIWDTLEPQILEKGYNYTEYFQSAANQYHCGSCYSFPIAATIEYLYKKHKNITIKLSEQQLIDCSSEDESVDGCTQGNITKGFEYARKVGLVEQEQYPYRSKNGHSFPCRKDVVDNPNVKKYKIEDFRVLPKENCEAIQYQLSQGNVVASMIAAGQLNEYTQIETAPFRNCPKNPFNHAITIVGQTEKQEWIIRNSWGSSWGKNGYFIMRGNNTCGICTHSIVPFLAAAPEVPSP